MNEPERQKFVLFFKTTKFLTVAAAFTPILFWPTPGFDREKPVGLNSQQS